MLNKKSHDFLTSFVLPLVLICVFAATSLSVSVLGVSVFKSMQAETEAATQCTIAAGYLRNKLTYAGKVDAVSLKKHGDIDVLVIKNAEQGPDYETRIFIFEGMLRESFVQNGTDFDPEISQKIASIAACVFKLQENGLFTATLKSLQQDEMRVAVQLAQGDSDAR